MAAIDKIRNDIEKTRARIAKRQKRLRESEQKTAEEENLEIVRIVKAVKLDNKELFAFLKAYVSGRVSLLEDMQADLKEQEDSEDEEQKKNAVVCRSPSRHILHGGLSIDRLYWRRT